MRVLRARKTFPAGLSRQELLQRRGRQDREEGRKEGSDHIYNMHNSCSLARLPRLRPSVRESPIYLTRIYEMRFMQYTRLRSLLQKSAPARSRILRGSKKIEGSLAFLPKITERRGGGGRGHGRGVFIHLGGSSRKRNRDRSCCCSLSI